MRVLGLISLSLILSLSIARAEPHLCPESVSQNPERQKSIDFLRSVAGQYKIGSCKIEIHVCSGNGNDPAAVNTMAADILVTDYKGFQRYIPIYFVNTNTARTQVHAKNYRRTFNYTFRDRIPDPTNGRYERHEIEIVKTDRLTGVEYMEFGFHTQTEKQKKVGKSWIICGGINDDALVAKRGYEICEDDIKENCVWK